MQADRAEADERWVTQMSLQVQDAEVELVANLGQAPVTLRQIVDLKVGDDVEHAVFGEGVVVEIKGTGDKAEVAVRFRERGTKHLALAWAPLKKL
jgi:flagellar motor switch protein FliM